MRLFVQSNSLALLPKLPFQDAFSSAQNLSGDLTQNPKANVDLYRRPSEGAVFIGAHGEIDLFRRTQDLKKNKIHTESQKQDHRKRRTKS